MTNADYHDHDTKHRRDIHFDSNNTTRHAILFFTAVKDIPMT
jgi:hypothetical protein